MRIGIVGLGLMGGSMALALKHISFVTSIIGTDHNEEHQRIALQRGLVQAIVPFEQLKAECDVIFLSVPVDGVIALLGECTDLSGTDKTLIDLGSTKALIVDAIPPSIRENFIPAHPMTGTEQFGPNAALEGLYADKVVVLCDLEHSGHSQRDTALRIFRSIGMQVHTMGAAQHDRHAAFISHMPHVISYALANTVLAQEEKENILTLAAGGFRSMSRLAKSSPAMWEDIFRQNRENVLEAIELFETELHTIKQALQEKDYVALRKEMKEANKLYEIFS
ncbi:MAG: prephenate dehydrogenase [Sulfuricurvum sp.]|uniref:prephenate dehydrogenase n=1 Tax=Sulfuricurvum sp. TaxID=2025608 RepID=UPI0026123D5C|nr:prephenate dehydrogenase [Sulfuricurvum sp.]MDD2839110.1 prephenate dehydrogenase [Sulfuricurvum sp.]MDD3596794.1 prephenate dehydrogenase [Sulfuricurvum sp.]MDD4884142.1 prephenate dehydrogenase [Sulfuricurvum sp.]